MPWAKGSAKLLSHPGYPIFIFRRAFKKDFKAKGRFVHVCKIFEAKKMLKMLLQGTLSIIVLRQKHYMGVIFIF